MMNRRNFLQLSAGAAALSSLGLNQSLADGALINSQKLNRVRLSITWGMLNKFPIPEALAKVSELGLDAYEMFNWRDPKVLETFITERKKYPNLECATLIANKGVEAPGCGLVTGAFSITIFPSGGTADCDRTVEQIARTKTTARLERMMRVVWVLFFMFDCAWFPLVFAATPRLLATRCSNMGPINHGRLCS